MEEIILRNFLSDVAESDDIEIAQWFIKEGDPFAADQSVVEVLITKAETEVCFNKAGRLVKIVAEEGEIVDIETVIAQVEFD